MQVNGPGLSALHQYLALQQAVAFLGAGISASLYPLWDGLVGQLVDAASESMSKDEASTCRALARESPEEVVEIVRRSLGTATYREVLREVLRVRTDPQTGRSWTPAQELVCRCAFKAVVTTNYDPGIVDARMRVRPGVSATGFTIWEDDPGLDRWRTGDVFGEAELPVLFAHGQHNRPDSVVLATTEYRRAYAGKLSPVLSTLMDAGHLVWIGFSFADHRISAILQEIANRTGTRIEPGAAPRHVAIMPWDPAAKSNNPVVLAQRAEISYGAQVILYPARGSDHSALEAILSALTDTRFPPAGDLPARTYLRRNDLTSDVIADVAPTEIAMQWIPTPERVRNFTGRAEELAKLDRWAAEPHIALVGITAWGGAGKTALVTRWVLEADGISRIPRVRGVFGWSFYADPSAEHWADRLLEWAQEDLGIPKESADRQAGAVLALLRTVPLLLVLDGLEVLQEGPAGGGFGRLLDGTLREVLVDLCRQGNDGLLLLTSRYPLADLEGFDGDRARMLEVPPFTPTEGSALLAAEGGGWVTDAERRSLAASVDGHALAVGVLAGLLAERPPTQDMVSLRSRLESETRTKARVKRVLDFYASRLGDPDRYLLAAISLFARPVSATAVLALAEHNAFEGHLAGWTPTLVQAAARDRLAGLVSWHRDETVSAHPLIRDTFRPLVLGAAGAAAETALAGIPTGMVTSRTDAVLVVEAVQLLLDAGQWEAADDLNRVRTGNGEIWKHLPAARLGERAASAFVATPDSRVACASYLGSRRHNFYLSSVGLFALYAGDLATAREFLSLSVSYYRQEHNIQDLAVSLRNLADCLGQLGDIIAAREAAAEALRIAGNVSDKASVRASHAILGWLAGLQADIAEAESQFAEADEIEVAEDPYGAHLYSIRGIWWAEWLARTGRPAIAGKLTLSNLELCRRYGWNQDVAHAQGLLGRLALATGDTATAGSYLISAAAEFRDGDLLPELATTLVDLGEHARMIGNWEAAERNVNEAIAIARPRNLVPIQSRALSAQARIRASHVADTVGTATGANSLVHGRDAADAALRLATRHQLAWHELDALRAHAILDQLDDSGHDWAAQADTLSAQLVPADLDPDPLATVVQRITGRKP